MDYHQDFSHVSKTMLNLFMRSRQEYYLTYVTREMAPKRVGRPAIAGTVLHAVTLEGYEFDDVVRLYPPEVLKCNGDLDGKKAAALRASYPDATFVKQAEYESLQAVVDGVLQDDHLSAILAEATHRERRMDGIVEGVECKCKPDIFCDLGQQIVVYDLKFMEDVCPDAWRRSSRRFRYWLQDAHYSATLESTWKKPVIFRFACIETQFPYRVIWRYYDPSGRESAREEHRRILRDLADCHASGNWADNWESVCVLEPWDLTYEDNAEVEIEA